MWASLGEKRTMPSSLRRPKSMSRRFCIDLTNDVSLVASKLPSRPASVTFCSERELLVRAAHWPSSRLVQIWNRFPQVTPVKRFTDRRTAVRRIWRAIQERPLNQITDAGTQKVASKEELRSKTKTAQIIELLKHPAGATLQSILDLTGWQPHSVRGFLSAQLSKKRGLRIESFTQTGLRVYRIPT
jgi:hypothetical protein